MQEFHKAAKLTGLSSHLAFSPRMTSKVQHINIFWLSMLYVVNLVERIFAESPFLFTKKNVIY